jgi:hypothetical protein
MESPVGVTVWPFAAYMDTDDFVLNRGEVDHTFTVPLSWFDEHEPEIGPRRTGYPAGTGLSQGPGYFPSDRLETAPDV